MISLKRGLWLLMVFGLYGCDGESTHPLMGTLEWDRVCILAEVAEPVLSWSVVEGEKVEAGQLLLSLDPQRQDAQIAQARATLDRVRWRAQELTNGSRSEDVEAARARVSSRHAAQLEAQRRYERVEQLHMRGLATNAELDRARADRDQMSSADRADSANLKALVSGARAEQLEQASADVRAAEASLALATAVRGRLDIRAPRAGRVDALPFRPGDQPPQGAEVASLLVGDVPYVRLFIPASRRAGIAVGDRLVVQVEGVSQPFAARIRSLRSEASFTPYYALAGKDASHLSYRAEAVLEDEAARQLPAGLPVQARFEENVQH